MRRLWLVVVGLLILMSSVMIGRAQTPLHVIATTTLIADVARNVGGDLVQITALIPPESDSHAYILTPREAATLESADLIFINGANLEASAITPIRELAHGQIITVSNGIEMLGFGSDGVPVGVLGVDAVCDDADEHDVDGHDAGHCDPHVWFNPRHVMTWTTHIADALAAAHPSHADIYYTNAAAYIAELAALDAEIVEILSVVPPEDRLLITHHDFLAYFADAYDFTVIGTVIPGLSTLSEPTPREVAGLVAILETTGVPVIFSERSASGLLADVVADEADHVVVVTLYSEALSAADQPAATYLDYMRFNAHTIADALSEHETG